MLRAIPLVLLLFLAPLTPAASLIANGSFEVGPTIPPAGYLALFDGDTSIPGWEVFEVLPGGSVDIKSTYWVASDGLNSIDLGGTPGPGGLRQTFATNPGELYTVLFDMAGNPWRSDRPVKTMEVSADGQSQQFSFDTTNSTMANLGWITQSFTFVADDTSATLAFAMVFPLDDNDGVALDNVRVYGVPEPRGAALGLLGLATLVALRRISGR